MVQPHISTIFPHLESEPKPVVVAPHSLPATQSSEKKRISWSEVSIDDGDDNYPKEPEKSKTATELPPPVFIPAPVSGSNVHYDNYSTLIIDEESQTVKRNRLQQCKLCFCRPMVIIIICAFLFLLIAAILAIVFSIVADNTEMRLEDIGNDLQPYTANLNELPEALQEQVLRGIQVRGLNNPYPNGMQQQQIGNPLGYNGVSNNGIHHSSPPPSYGYPYYGK